MLRHSRGTRRLAGLATALALAGAAGTPALACPTPEQGFSRVRAGGAEIAVRWDPAELKVGLFHMAEVVACSAPGGGPIEAIAIDADMPAHGHGMNYRPKAERIGAGHYRFTGLMLHMPGTWRLTFDLLQGGKRTRLTHEVNLKR
jgi:hypothetical protein